MTNTLPTSRSVVVALFTLLSFFYFMSTSASACDICGCGSGASFMGLIPQFGRSQISLRTNYRSYVHPNTQLNYNGKSRVLQDDLFSTDLSYRRFLRNWMLTASLPMKSNIRHESLRTTVNNGIGDAQLGALYTLVNNTDSMDVKWKHLLSVGGALRVPTGKYMQRDDAKTMLPVLLQTGTGAYAFMPQLYYTIRHRRWGALASAQFTIAAKNELSYRWGNQSMLTTALFYKRDLMYERKQRGAAPYSSGQQRMVNVLPSLGYTIENAAQDTEFDLPVAHTGGTVQLISASLDIYVGKMAFSMYYQHTLLELQSGAMPSNTHRMGAALVWLLH